MSEEAQEVEAVDTDAAALAAFTSGQEAGQSEDDIKMGMIQAGATFKNVTRLFNQFMIDTGRAMSRDAKAELLDKILTEADLSTEEGFKKATAAIVKKGTNVTEGSAASLTRAWAKKAEVECYKAPASEGGTRNPFISIYHAALIENPNMDEAGLQAVIDGLEKDEWKVNPQRWFNQQNTIRKMVNSIAAKYA